MVDVKTNEDRNEQLEKLYEDNKADFLAAYEECFGERKPSLLDFGIIDPKCYDTDDGILIVMREASAWNYEGADGATYLDFVHDVIERKNNSGVNMLPWYNLGRWVTAIRYPNKPTEEIAGMYDEALQALRMAAVTNVNKVTGYKKSGKEFYALARKKIAVDTVRREIEILDPKVIIFGGTWWEPFGGNKEFMETMKGRVILDMWHPGAGKKTTEMIEEIRRQLKEQLKKKG